jgi:hypothetical protein
MNSLQYMLGSDVLCGMIAKCPARQPDGFRYRVGGDIAAPFLDDCFPSDSRSHLVQNVSHQDARPSKRRLAVTDGGIGDDVPPGHPSARPAFASFRHSTVSSTIIAGG